MYFDFQNVIPSISFSRYVLRLVKSAIITSIIVFQVKIFSTEEPFFCPAVFISTDALLASALCLKMMQHADEHPTNHMFALVDREDVFFYEHGRRYLSKIFYHPKFEDEPAYYNVAIVKLRNLV